MGMRVRVMTYNVKSGRNHKDGLEAAARIIGQQAPDVLGLQEVDDGMARTAGIAQADWLTRRLHMRGLFAPAMAYDGGLFGIALLSRWPIQAHQRQPLFKPDYPDAAARPRHDSEPRVMLASRLSAFSPDDDSLCVVVTHLGLTPDQRAIQVRELDAFARSWSGGQPVVVMGDFNCAPEAPELAPLRKHFRDACAVCGVGDEARYTFPSGPRGARTPDGWRGAIDYIWVSPGINVVSARVLEDESQASDHQPLVVELEL